MAESLLPSWRAGATRSPILDFLDARIDVWDRVAVFDNDGTLGCEKPRYSLVYPMIFNIEADHRELRRSRSKTAGWCAATR